MFPTVCILQIKIIVNILLNLAPLISGKPYRNEYEESACYGEHVDRLAQKDYRYDNAYHDLPEQKDRVFTPYM